LAPIVLVSITAMTTYGLIRLRFLAELPLVVLAAAGALALWDRRSRPHNEATRRGQTVAP
jgi:hypothetical protein